MTAQKKATVVSSSVAAFLTLLKLTIGIFSGSVAVLASAVDSILDMFVSIFNMIAVRVSESKADNIFNYGKGKIEGILKGNTLTCKWSEAPTYKPKHDAGDCRFEFSPDGKTFKGYWRYGFNGTSWNGKWNGKTSAPFVRSSLNLPVSEMWQVNNSPPGRTLPTKRFFLSTKTAWENPPKTSFRLSISSQRFLNLKVNFLSKMASSILNVNY